MHDERFIARNGIVAFCAFRWLVIWRFGLGKVGIIQASPLFLVFVPPHKLLVFAPGLSIRTGGGTVVENAPIARPGIAPSMPVTAFRFSLQRLVFIARWHHAGINPASARGRTIIFQFFISRELFAIGSCVAVNLSKNVFSDWLSMRPFGLVIPCKSVQSS